jgi:pyruvate dehydrogenase E1 component alpha subunit
MEIENVKLIWMYRSMVRHREFELSVRREIEAGHMPGFFHLSLGQEAITAGALAAIGPDDNYLSTHRAHPRQVIRGEKAERVMAELFGKATGTLKGKGGTIHLCNLPIGDLGTDGMIGTQLVVAPGAALSAKLKGTDQVTLCFHGDGSTNSGAFHEGLNLASIWKLPVVFVCENNQLGCTTSIYDVMNVAEISDRAYSYGIPSMTIDGNDVIAVYEAVSAAVIRARKGGGPSYIDCKTCRWGGHYHGDAQTYRTKKEIDECIKKDPLPKLKNKLLENGVLTVEEVRKIHEEAVEEMARAVQFAQESPSPSLEEVFTDVYG